MAKLRPIHPLAPQPRSCRRAPPRFTNPSCASAAWRAASVSLFNEDIMRKIGRKSDPVRQAGQTCRSADDAVGGYASKLNQFVHVPASPSWLLISDRIDTPSAHCSTYQAPLEEEVSFRTGCWKRRN